MPHRDHGARQLAGAVLMAWAAEQLGGNPTAAASLQFSQLRDQAAANASASLSRPHRGSPKARAAAAVAGAAVVDTYEPVILEMLQLVAGLLAVVLEESGPTDLTVEEVLARAMVGPGTAGADEGESRG